MIASFPIRFLTGFRLPHRYNYMSVIERHAFIEQPIEYQIDVYVYMEALT
jgi:hypothetical protein